MLTNLADHYPPVLLPVENLPEGIVLEDSGVNLDLHSVGPLFKEEIGQEPAPPADAEKTPPAPPETITGPVLADGIPWDARIHTPNKTILKKAPHGWRLKKNIDPEIVKQVVAELRIAMMAGSDVIAPPDEEEDDGDIIKIGDLMERITDDKIEPGDILIAVQKQGLPNIQALLARPDLVGQVYRLLFESGE